jgi:hypothetical protein
MANRVLSVKLDIDRDQFQRLRDLGWQAAHYRNMFVRRKWAEAMGYVVLDSDDKHSVTKAGRKTDKAELSGAAYSACEREVAGAWQRDCRKILAGQPLPEWKPTAALSVRGHKRKAESGIRLEIEDGRYVAYLQAQAATCDGGCWLRLPAAKNEGRDKHQGPVLNSMVAWETAIAKAQISLSPVKRKATLKLTYEVAEVLPAMGERVATLGPVERDGRLHLRTETQTKDYSSRLNNLLRRKDVWDLFRRRALRQIGRRHGHARIKRQVLANKDWADWVKTHLHTWSRDIADWCQTQGVGTIRVVAIDTGDWPAYRFVELLKYKAAEHGITVDGKASLGDESTQRAASAAIKKQQRKAKRAREAVVDLEDHFGFQKR